MSDIKLGIIGGSGIGDLLVDPGHLQQHDMDTPFGKPSGVITEALWEGLPVLLLARHGAGHLINPGRIPVRANIFALKQLGCTHIIACGAVGSLRQEFKPKDLVIADQIIDKSQGRATTFYEKSAVHVEMAEPFCPVLRQILVDQGTAKVEGSVPEYLVHDRGCYVCMEGPAFSTRAESLMHRLWGGDLIGMTVMPEAKLAREAEIAYAMIALVTDYDCWKPRTPVAPGQPPVTPAPPVDPAELLKEIIANLQAASANAMQLIRKAVKAIAANPEAVMASPARQALKLAIWSDKSKVDPEEVRRLSPLWGKYFE